MSGNTTSFVIVFFAVLLAMMAHRELERRGFAVTREVKTPASDTNNPPGPPVFNNINDYLNFHYPNS